MTKDEALELAIKQFYAFDFVMKRSESTEKAIAAIKQALAAQPAPVQETDWSHAWLLIKAASYASSQGHISGTTNWGAAMSAYLRHETKAAAQPAPVQPVGRVCFEGDEVVWTDEPPESGALLYTTPPAQSAPVQPVAHTYASTQATMCACCGEHKHTPLRIDKMDGYVCLTCIDKKLGSLLGEFGYPPAPAPAVPDAIHHTDLSEHPQYIEGWNDCRAEMLKGMK
jgi:hypothetical protein